VGPRWSDRDEEKFWVNRGSSGVVAMEMNEVKQLLEMRPQRPKIILPPARVTRRVCSFIAQPILAKLMLTFTLEKVVQKCGLLL
jgi:hypothetical protein